MPEAAALPAGDGGAGGMSAWLLSIEGTEAGRLLAMALALGSALLHAIFGALQKGRHDPWLSRGAMDFAYGLMAAPLALLVVPWPAVGLWPILAVSLVIHTGYKLVQAMAYMRGAFTVVYPVVRGTGPVFAVTGAWLLFAERFAPLQWLGLALLVGGIFGLALYNLRTVRLERATLIPALALAVLTGAFVASYTTWDAHGIRSSADPFTYLAWLFTLDGLFVMPAIALVRWRRMAPRPPLGPLAARGLFGGVVALLGFGGVMLATRLDKVGEAAVLRETSVVFAALIGWLLLKESVGARRFALMALIALGAVIVEAGR